LVRRKGRRDGPALLEIVGADVALVGPGEAYQRWTKTPDYLEWRKKTHP